MYVYMYIRVYMCVCVYMPLHVQFIAEVKERLQHYNYSLSGPLWFALDLNSSFHATQKAVTLRNLSEYTESSRCARYVEGIYPTHMALQAYAARNIFFREFNTHRSVHL